MLSLTPWNKHDLGIRPLADRCVWVGVWVGGGVGGWRCGWAWGSNLVGNQKKMCLSVLVAWNRRG